MLKYGSLVISITLAVLYCLGISFYQGFIGSFGIDETQFQLSVDRLFFQGFVALADMSTSGFIWLVAAASGVVIVAQLVTLAAVFISRYDFSRILPLWLTESQGNKPEDHPFVEFSLKMFSYVILMFVSFLAILLVLIASDKSGKSYAEKYKEAAASHPKLIVTIQTKGEQYKGRSITCSETQCAYWLKDHSIVLNKRDIKIVSSK